MTQLLYAYISESTHHLLLETHLQNFPKEFQEKVLKYRRWEDAQLSILGRLLLTQGLKNIGETYSEDEIIYSKYDKPSLKKSNIKFNISHSGMLVLCIITDRGEVGIDIEKTNPINIKDFEMQMLPSEIDTIENSLNTQKAFFKYWTQKEAVIKAHGHGLSLPLTSFEVLHKKAQIEDELFYVEEIEIDPAYICHFAIKGTEFTDEIQIKRIQFFEIE